MHYTAHIDLAFLSIGTYYARCQLRLANPLYPCQMVLPCFLSWFIHTHFVVYIIALIHSPRGLLWNVGVTILFLMIGYRIYGLCFTLGPKCLFGGQTVITNLFSAIAYLRFRYCSVVMGRLIQ